MKQHDLDKLFRDKLKEREFEVSETAWASMSDKLDTETSSVSRPLRFWWLLFLAGSLGVVLFTFWPNSQMDESLILSEKDNQETNVLLEENEVLLQRSIGLKSDLNESENSIEEETRLIKDEKDKELAITNNNSLSPTENIKTDLNQKASFNLSKGNSNPNKESDMLSSDKENDGELNLSSDKLNGIKNIRHSGKNAETGDQESQKPQINMPSLTDVHNNEGSDLSDYPDVKDFVGNTRPEIQDKGIENLNLFKSKLIDTKLSLLTPNYELNTIDFIPNKLLYKKWNFELGFFAGISSVSKKLSTSIPDFEAAVSYRNQNEEKDIKPEWGLELDYSNHKWSLQTGLTFGEYGEEIQYEDILQDSTVFTQNTEIQFIDTMFWEFELDTAGMVIDSIWTTQIIDSIEVTTIDSMLVQFTNNLSEKNGRTRISYFEIPLVMGYKFRKNKLEFRPEIGVSLGVLKAKEGYYLSNENDELVRISEDVIFRKTILNAIYGFRLGYHISSNFKVNLHLGQRKNLNSVFENTDVNQRYTSSFARIGLRYTF